MPPTGILAVDNGTHLGLACQGADRAATARGTEKKENGRGKPNHLPALQVGPLAKLPCLGSTLNGLDSGWPLQPSKYCAHLGARIIYRGTIPDGCGALSTPCVGERRRGRLVPAGLRKQCRRTSCSLPRDVELAERSLPAVPFLRVVVGLI